MPCAGRVEAAAWQLTRAGRCELRSEVHWFHPRRCRNGLDEFQHADRRAGADVILSTRKLSGSGCGEVGCRNVADKNEVASLPAVTENRRPPSRQHAITEDRDHTSVPARILPGTIDIAVPQCHHVQAPHTTKPVGVTLGGKLAKSVR